MRSGESSSRWTCAKKRGREAVEEKGDGWMLRLVVVRSLGNAL